jgi:RNA polymerase sigma-70 factor (ECF subfamily)
VAKAGEQASLSLEVDERTLVQQAQQNDTRAYEQLYRLHQGRVYGLCMRLCRDRDMAEDLTQEAFVLAWRKLATFRGDSAFGSWLYRITTNVALSYLRKQKTFLTSLTSENREEPSAEPKVEERMTLDKAIQQLPDGARAVFVLYSVEGYSHGEIGGMLKIAVGSSKAQLHRARQLLQRYLENDG